MAVLKRRNVLLSGFTGVFLLALLIFLPPLVKGESTTAAPPFELTDQSGHTLALADLKGKIVVLTFLYTGCLEVCPAYISKMQQAVEEVGASGDVALVAITVDPERDTVDRLSAYTAHLSPNWKYLTGEPGPLKVAWDNYGISVAKRAVKNGALEAHAGHGTYEVDHTAKAILIDREGLVRSELVGDWPVPELEDKLRSLLAGEDVTRGTSPWRSFVGFLYDCGPVSITSLSVALGHFLLILAAPLVAYGMYRVLAR